MRLALLSSGPIAGPELERLSQMTPNLALYRDLARGCLALLRGKPERAARLYERVLNDPRHPLLPSRLLDRTYYAEVLSALGRDAEAKQICEEVLSQKEHEQRRERASSASWAVAPQEPPRAQRRPDRRR